MELTEKTQRFVSHFGEMGSRWGINRTVGQMYALLFTSKKPLCADDIASMLQISRSNVSMGIKELESWRLLKIEHFPGDRKDYFTVPGDVWDIMRTLIEERRRREIEPTLSLLRDLMLMNDEPTRDDEFSHQRMRDMYNLIELLTTWYQDMQNLDNKEMQQLMSLGSQAIKLIGLKNKILPSKTSETDA